MSQLPSSRGARVALVLTLFAIALGALAGCGGSDEAGGGGGGHSFSGDASAGIDPANTRHVPGASIDRESVASLEVAWSLPLTAQSTYGAYASIPVVADGVVYSQDLESNVQAIDLASGEVLWSKRYGQPTGGPNGVVVAAGKVFGATDKAAFALDQASGRELWSTPLVKNPAGEAVDMAPGYSAGLVYVSTVPAVGSSQYPGGGVGTLYALDAKTGREKWRFATVPASLWGDRRQNSGGGLWYPPSFDGKGSMYFGTGNPAPFPGTSSEPWGQSRPGANLYTNSVVRMDAKTGELDWHYQQTPHDLYDWDFQNPPVLLDVGGRELAIGSGKSGFVTALDAKTGKPVWSTAVGRHNGHDGDGLLAMRGEYSKLKGGLVYPGYLGGVIAPVAASATTIYVPVVNAPVTVSGSQIGGAEPTGPAGELVALDAATGKQVWDAQFEGPAYGSPVLVNDLVFATSFEGVVHAFDAKTGGEVWQANLPAGTNSGVTVSGDTLLAPAGLAVAEGQRPALVAYSLVGGE